MGEIKILLILQHLSGYIPNRCRLRYPFEERAASFRNFRQAIMIDHRHSNLGVARPIKLPVPVAKKPQKDNVMLEF